jgi:hypothetical protein
MQPNQIIPFRHFRKRLESQSSKTMANNRDIARTAATIRGRKYPFVRLTDRDRSYLQFWTDLIGRHGGSVTLHQIADSATYPKYAGSRKPYDAGVATRLSKAGLISISSDGNTLAIAKISAVEDEGAKKEVKRQQRLGKIASRPGQKRFSSKLRVVYGNTCAITGCRTTEALEAAHIRIDEEHQRDFDETSNGILLRADIHALFDAGLIALTMDGAALDVSEKLEDISYDFLRNVKVYRPKTGAPSPENILHHRRRLQPG